jgi:PAS domain S-box-containing protein
MDGRKPRLVDEPGFANALSLILRGILVSTLAIVVLTLMLRWFLVAALSFVVALAAAVALALARKGRIRSGTLVVLTSAVYAALHLSAVSDGIQDTALTIIPGLIITSALLLNGPELIFLTGTVTLATFGMLAIRDLVLRAGNYSTGDWADFAIFAIICATAAVVGWVISAHIREGYRLAGASERRYRRIFENIQDAYFEMRTDGILTELSPAGATLFGARREAEMIGKSAARFCVNQAEHEALLESLLATGRVTGHTLTICDSAKKLKTVSINALLQKGREPVEERIIGSIRDISKRIEAEEALRESEARLRLAIEATGAGTFDYYPQEQKLILSDLARRHLGISAETEAGRAEFLRAVFLEQPNVGQTEAGAGGRVASEYRVIGSADRKERWIAVQGRMGFDSAGRPNRLIGTTLEITERRRLEEELRQRVEEMQIIMDRAPVALFVAKDAECREIAGNRMGNRLLGATDDAKSLPTFGDAPPDWRVFRDGIELGLSELPLPLACMGIEVPHCDLELLRADGTRRLLYGHASPLHDAAGRVRGAIAAFQDVTDARRQADAALRESEDRFRNTANAAPVILWLGDTEKRVAFVNDEMVRFTGFPAERLLGGGWEQVIHPDDLEEVRAIYYAGVESRSSYQLEYRARRADGEYRSMLSTTRPRYVGNQYAGQMGSVIDITELKRRSEEDFARQKLESVGVLANGIAHDFNNLLGSVMAQAELALVEISSGASPVEELQTIGKVAKRGAEIVRQLMVYAGKESGGPSQVDVSRIVKDMLELLEFSVSKHAVLKTDLREDLPAVNADAGQVRQVVMNLVMNASDAMGERDGVIRVVTRRVAGGHGIPGTRGERLAEGDYVELEVSDTGCGIATEVQAKMFDPFFTTKSDGRGMGLAVVQGAVRSLGGTIDFSSEIGTGTTFRVFLPCSDQPAEMEAVANAPTEKANRASKKANVLIVEDEILLRQSVAKMLCRAGFTTVEASDGNAALKAIESYRNSLDVLFLDITIPGASSHEVFEAAKRLIPGIKVIVSSAYSEKFAAESLEGEVEHFIRKPYRVGELVAQIRESIGSS